MWLIIRPHCSIDSLHADPVKPTGWSPGINLVHGLVQRWSIPNAILLFCRTWSSKCTLKNILCLPVSKDYKTKSSSSLKHLHVYTYPYNGILIAFHIPVFLKLERNIPSSEEKGIVFQAGWSDYSASTHSVTEALHLPRNYCLDCVGNVHCNPCTNHCFWCAPGS